MLNLLHKKISEIVPINGVAYDINKQIVIDYITPPSESEFQLINNVLNNWPLEILKNNAIQRLENDWANTVSSGWTTSFGWKLGLDIQDVTLLTGAFMLAKEAAAMGISSPISIVDTDGVAHYLSLEEMTTLMLQYGQARALMSAQYATSRTAILDSNTLEDLDQVLNPTTTTTTTTTTVEPNNDG